MASLADALEYQQKRQQMLNSLNDQPTDLEKAVQDQFGMQPNMDRAALLPYKSKDVGWVAPEAVYQLAKLLASPATALKGGNISNQEAIEAGNTLSGFMTPAGLASKIEPGMANMTVYHGTPHKFDAFDASKIGTGEGAQAYGHGIYVAESPEVAKRYQNALAKDKQASDLNTKLDMVMVGNKKITDYGLDSDAALIDAARNGNEAVKAHASNSLSRWNELANDPTYPFKKYAEEKSAAYSSLLKDIDHNHVSYAGDGSFLTVDLPDSHIDRMLDWDKPLSEQHPDVQKVIADEIKRIGGSASTGEQAYKELMFDSRMNRATSGSRAMRNNQDAIEASERLRQLGIPGIKYLDQGSRGTGNGTRNFVVFPGEEHNLKILDRK